MIKINDTDGKNRILFEQTKAIFQDSAIRDRSYYPDFRREWDILFQKALSRKEQWLPEDERAIYTVHNSVFGIDEVLHFDRIKLKEWFANEQKRKSKAIFYPKKLKRDTYGNLFYHDSPCRYDKNASEDCLPEEDRNIIACALPSLPPELTVVYGNKWVEDRFRNPFRQRSVSLYLIETDFVPAFLGSPFEVCLYLFLMDCCIIKSDYTKVKDDDLKKFLHIFRPSPMLKIKGLK